MTILYLNGKFVEHQDAALDPLDRGVLLGDGVFETIRCEEGQLLFHSAHFARLGRNARIMEIPWNMHSEELLQVCQQCLDANGLEAGRLRITVTRGELGSSPEINVGATAPTVIVSAHHTNQTVIEESRARGWSARVVHFPLNHRSPLAEVKSTSYQERLLARMVAKRDGFDEGIMLNTDGLVAEGAMTNLFIVRDGGVVTPPVEDGAPYPYPIISYEAPAAAPASSDAPAIDVWYGTTQNFGQLGNPQQWVNIPGTATGTTSLKYSLNGGPDQTLSLGPTGERLYGAGDFNIELAITELVEGANTVLIKANDGVTQVTKTVTVNYDAGNTWPMPYTANWSALGSVQAGAQVVDGLLRDGVVLGDLGHDATLIEMIRRSTRLPPRKGLPHGAANDRRWWGRTGRMLSRNAR